MKGFIFAETHLDIFLQWTGAAWISWRFPLQKKLKDPTHNSIFPIPFDNPEPESFPVPAESGPHPSHWLGGHAWETTRSAGLFSAGCTWPDRAEEEHLFPSEERGARAPQQNQKFQGLAQTHWGWPRWAKLGPPGWATRAHRDSCCLKICVGPLSPRNFFSGEVCILLWSRRMQTQMVRQAEVWIQSATGLESQLLTHYATLSKLLNLSEPWLSGL